jgi:hypothetical protein
VSRLGSSLKKSSAVLRIFGLTPYPLSAGKLSARKPGVAERGRITDPLPSPGLSPSEAGFHAPGEPLALLGMQAGPGVGAQGKGGPLVGSRRRGDGAARLGLAHRGYSMNL